MAASSGLADAVGELYGLTPDEFTAARNERAKAAKEAGDKELAQEIGKLRKPPAAAWIINQLVRHHGDEIDQFLAVGAALREAQSQLDADQLKELSRERHQVVAAVGRQARALGRRLGHPVSESVATEVEQTLRAALADPDAAAAVASGSLTKTLDYAGLGDTRVDLAGAVAVPGAGPARAPAARPKPAPAQAPERSEEELEAARREADEAEREATDAEERLAAAERLVSEAEDRRGDLEARVAELERELEEAREGVSAAGREIRTAARERDRAARHAETARTAADRSRTRLEKLRG